MSASNTLPAAQAFDAPELDPEQIAMLRSLRKGALLPQLLRTYRDQAPQQFAAMHAALAAGDIAALGGVAHSLKSASYSIGAKRIGDLCAALEASARSGDGSMGLLSAMDLVIAMPVSWLPLVADYARHGRTGRGALTGTWLGYAIANVWCYALGVMVVSVAQPDANLVSSLLLAQGGLIALSLILIDEIDNAYGDVYSSAVSAHSIKPAVSIRQWGLGLALLSTGLALVLPMHSLEPFLLTLSSVFVPLFGVILGRLGTGQPSFAPAQCKVDWASASMWVGGIATYHALAHWMPQWGAALPTLALTFLTAALIHPARLKQGSFAG